MSPHLPDLIKLYVKNCLIGFVLSAVFVGGLLWFDVMGLQRLVLNSGIGGVIAVTMLFIFNGLVFAGVQFAVAIMLMADDDDDDDKGHRDPIALRDPIPIRVRH